MRYKATFIGREKGAIGAFYKIIATVDGRDEDDARLNLYDRYEHISQLTLDEKPPTKKQRRDESIRRHCDSLVAIAASLGFLAADGERMNRQLRAIERKAHDAATAQCNGERYGSQPYREEEGWDEFRDDIANEVAAVFGGHQVVPGFFVNGDPRGYALKIDNENPKGKALIDSARLHTDWGGYGILAPDLSAGL